VSVEANLLPGEDFATAEAWFLGQVACRPRALVATALALRLPSALAAAVLERTGVDRATALSALTRDARRALVRSLVELPLAVRDSRGYAYAEVTAGGIPLEEVDAKTMESRRCPGLFLVGEILDVDGRIGGFNFQWGWSSAWVAARGLVPHSPRKDSAAPLEKEGH
jgi:predicted flavoprotein YhiN